MPSRYACTASQTPTRGHIFVVPLTRTTGSALGTEYATQLPAASHVAKAHGILPPFHLSSSYDFIPRGVTGRPSARLGSVTIPYWYLYMYMKPACQPASKRCGRADPAVTHRPPTGGLPRMGVTSRRTWFSRSLGGSLGRSACLTGPQGWLGPRGTAISISGLVSVLSAWLHTTP